RILRQTRSVSVSLYIMARAWSPIPRHGSASLHSAGQILHATRRWACGGPLQ
ncbi:hypothetical protein M9458_032003, partial [Cirrhinus mrigala]